MNTELVKNIKIKIASLQRKMWISYYSVKNSFRTCFARHSNFSICLFFCWVISVCVLTYTQNQIQNFFTNQKALSVLENIFIASGGSLLGASVIVFSFATLALQNHLENFSYTTLQRLPTPNSFTFSTLPALSAIAIILCTLFVSSSTSPLLIGLTVTLITLYFYSLQKAWSLFLRSITSGSQADRLTQTAIAELKKTKKLHQRTSSALPEDLDWIIFLKANSNWSQGIITTCQQLFVIADNCFSKNDNEGAGYAFAKINELAIAYIIFTDKALSLTDTDRFISRILEEIKIRFSRYGTRNSEEALLKLIELERLLVETFSTIKKQNCRRHHIHLCIGYLRQALKNNIDLSLQDVHMRGIELLGFTAKKFLLLQESGYAAGLFKDITELGCKQFTFSAICPIAHTAINQLISLEKEVLLVSDRDVRYLFQELHGSFSAIVLLIVSKPDTPLVGNYHSYLSAYYNPDSLFINELKGIQGNIETLTRERVSYNLMRWVDSIVGTQPKVIFASAKTLSPLLGDLSLWTLSIVKAIQRFCILTSIPDDLQKTLTQKAGVLLSTLDHIPSQKEVVAHVELYQMSSNLFNILASETFKKENILTHQAFEIYLNWINKLAHHNTYGTFHYGLIGIAVLRSYAEYSSFVDYRPKINRILTSLSTSQLTETVNYLRNQLAMPTIKLRPPFFYSAKTDNELSLFMKEIEEIILEGEGLLQSTTTMSTNFSS